MKKAMWKTTLREIKQSFGRFFAILAIVALGVGMFAGLKVTKAAMVETTQGYLDTNQFFDLHILSTIGFDEEDEKQFQEQEDVRMAEGAISLDVLFLNANGNEYVIKAHSLPQDINGVVLVKGRMPQQANECVMDSQMDIMFNVGDTITISNENTESDKDNFTFEEYTIVGQIQSSYYIQFERGNTSLGTGQVTGFIYFQPEAFQLDYYTEMFVKFNQDMPLYSTEYEEFIEDKTTNWEPFAQESAELRFDRLLIDANQELKDGKDELASKKAEAEEELEDARIELADAADKIADGKTQLAKAKTDLADAKRTVTEKTEELEDGEKTLIQEEQKLIDGEKEIAENLALFEKEKASINDGEKQVNAAQEEVTSNYNNVKAQETALIQKEAGMLNQEQELIRQEGELNQHLAELNQYEAALIEQFGTVPEPYASEIAKGRKELEQSLNLIEYGKMKLQMVKFKLKKERNRLQ